ncbi:MFS transporter [Staphylothermus hellenicus]|uniref:Major facilitator superfamily MFS_1 n=1 Tax=Staphylothermus hellenicus (strain DSM 12710 / JCM 10830 / BK20S6-10-b1 / P8) TaxID=591019 RepID=D7DBY4_STAHD|nr:MFS transporter [Staphylothermus hellenicus]ADI31681.1 major facilitator superfamily MFS_1 [Staphylothermus hellenicus DSM 12710]
MSETKNIHLKTILLTLALLVLSYFAGDYMLAAVIDPMYREGIIPGTAATWRTYAGLLKTIPGFVGLALTIVWGVLADKIGRPRLLFILGITMGVSLALVGFAMNYIYLLLVLTIFGIAKIGIGPVIYAFIPDIMPPEKRGLGYAAYYAPSVLGFVVGMIIGGILFYWRTAYLLVGLMILVFAVPLYLLSRGIRIGFAEKKTIEKKYRFMDALRATMNKTITLMMIQIIPWSIPWGFVTLFAVDYIMKRWGLSKPVASGILAIAALSIATGHVLGGKLADNLVRKGDINGRVKISVVGIAIGYLAMLGMFIYPYPYGSTAIADLLPPVILALAGLMFTTFAYPNISSVISDCTYPEYRGTVFSLYNILNTSGWAIGPVIYGLITGYYISTGLAEKTALMYSAVLIEALWLISLIIWIIIGKTYPRDRIQ